MQISLPSIIPKFLFLIFFLILILNCFEFCLIICLHCIFSNGPEPAYSIVFYAVKIVIIQCSLFGSLILIVHGLKPLHVLLYGLPLWNTYSQGSEPNFCKFLQSVGSGAQTEVSFVSWNPKFQHILASTSYNGITGATIVLF